MLSKILFPIVAVLLTLKTISAYRYGFDSFAIFALSALGFGLVLMVLSFVRERFR